MGMFDNLLNDVAENRKKAGLDIELDLPSKEPKISPVSPELLSRQQNMILTTGFDLQGYFITEYVDVVFDEMLVGLGFFKSIASGLDNVFSAFCGTEATTMIEKLNSVKSSLRKRVIEKAAILGADALIGIDFESSKLGDLMMVSMTATAVKNQENCFSPA